ncbi:MAG: hypothetical protein IJS58_02870 [Bacilli bacterium]|nr:hypothetical protein [Bacilli bacterium]
MKKNRLIFAFIFLIFSFFLIGCEEKIIGEEIGSGDFVNKLYQEVINSSYDSIHLINVMSEKGEYERRIYQIEEGTEALNNYVGINENNQLVSIIDNKVISDTYDDDNFKLNTGKKVQNVYTIEGFIIYPKVKDNKKYMVIYHENHLAAELEVDKFELFLVDSRTSLGYLNICNQDKTFNKYLLINNDDGINSYEVKEEIGDIENKDIRYYPIYDEKGVKYYYSIDNTNHRILIKENGIQKANIVIDEKGLINVFQLKDKLIVYVNIPYNEFGATEFSRYSGCRFYELDLTSFEFTRKETKDFVIINNKILLNNNGGFAESCLEVYGLKDYTLDNNKHYMYIFSDKLDFDDEKTYEEYLFANAYKIGKNSCLVLGKTKLYLVRKETIKSYDVQTFYTIFGVFGNEVYYQIGKYQHISSINDFLTKVDKDYNEDIYELDRNVVEGEIRSYEIKDGKTYIRGTNLCLDNWVQFVGKSNYSPALLVYENKVYTYNGKEVILECSKQIDSFDVLYNAVVIKDESKTYLIGAYFN